ncbi:hypothetical protein MTO96_047770 [Rhipicephalus appendiculatus]
MPGLRTHEDIDTIHFEGTIPFAVPLANHHHKIVIGHNHYCDAAGRLWTGTMAIDKKPMNVEPEQGSMYSIEKKHIRKHIERITLPNGIAWTADNKKMFFVDSVPGKLYVYDFDLAKGDISNQKVVADFNHPNFAELAFPDGITIDQTDKLWVACYNGGHVVKIDPVTGALVQKSQPDAGAIFKISGIPGTKGLPPNCFAM